jgi:hypothetical protein
MSQQSIEGMLISYYPGGGDLRFEMGCWLSDWRPWCIDYTFTQVRFLI